MDLQHGIIALRQIVNFYRPLAKASDLLQLFLDLEKAEIEQKKRFDAGLEKITAVNFELKKVENALQEMKNNYKEEVLRVNEIIQAEKTKVIEQYDIKISKQKEDLLLLQGRNGSMTLEIKNLEKKRVELKDNIDRLRKVITDTNSMVSNV